MNKVKERLFNELVNDMGKCSKCLRICSRSGVDKSLINIFCDKDFCREIPSIWTDWYNRLDSSIMIIGQDWGPYDDMRKLHELYVSDKSFSNWSSLIDSEKSLTKRNLTKFINLSSKGRVNNLDNIYITNAIMCARKGSNYRGDNIDLKTSSKNCGEFLLRQIEIVRPKVIVTMGYYPLLSLSLLFGFSIEKNLTLTIESTPIIKVNNYVIIPIYHSASQIKSEEQLKQYNRIWEFV